MANTITAVVFFFETIGTGTYSLPFKILPCRVPNEQVLSMFMPNCHTNPFGDKCKLYCQLSYNRD